jgi:uncharacterized membrane protein
MTRKKLSKSFLLVNAIFAITAIIIERVGISLEMYVYAETSFHVFDVPLLIIASWVIVGHTSWVAYKKFGCVAGLLTGIIIDLPIEFMAFHLGWWTWIPSWSPPIFFSVPIANFLVWLSVSFGSILIYKYVMKKTDSSTNLHV